MNNDHIILFQMFSIINPEEQRTLIDYPQGLRKMKIEDLLRP